MLPLAYAEATDDSAGNLRLLLIALVVIGVTTALAAVPVLGARRRRHPQVEVIGAAMLIWAIALAWSCISAVAGRMDWEKENNVRVQSGYDSNPADAAMPAFPVLFWSTLAAGWVLVDAWALLLPTRTGSAQAGTASAPLPRASHLHRVPESSAGTGSSPPARS